MRNIKKIPFDKNGHVVREELPEKIISHRMDRIFPFEDYCDCRDEEEIEKTLENHRRFKEIIERREEVSWMDLGNYKEEKCCFCEEYPHLLFNGVSLKLEKPCCYRHSGIPLSFLFNFPSGKIVSGDLDPYFFIYGEFDQTELGLVKTSLAMADIGCVQLFVGCRRRQAAIYDEGKSKNGGPVYIVGPSKKKVISRLTADYNRIMFSDYDEFVRRAGFPPEEDKSLRIIPVVPGVYQFIHHIHEMQITFANDSARDKMRKYTTINWIRPPDSAKDYEAVERKRELTAGQCVWRFRKEHKSQSVEEVLNVFFCSANPFPPSPYHPNGFFQPVPDMQFYDPEEEIPEILKDFKWGLKEEKGELPYFFSSPLILAANGELKLNKSFAKLAIKVADAIAASAPCTEDQRNLAADALRKLRERYPEK